MREKLSSKEERIALWNTGKNDVESMFSLEEIWRLHLS